MKFIIATHNQKKLEELIRILAPLGIEGVAEELAEVEETGKTFAENAFLKANAACLETGMPAIADDSGLVVDALSGAPGVYSARYAGENATDEDRNNKLLGELKNVQKKKRTARYVSAICCVFPNGDFITAQGTCEGVIAKAPTGSGGFGYDPIFLVDGISFGEIPSDEKDGMSHRGKALANFADKLTEYINQI